MGDARLFVYAEMLAGEPEHTLLGGAQLLGVFSTEPHYALYDLGVYGALVGGGAVAISGELYLVTDAALARIDVARQVPLLFRRCAVQLAGGAEAQSHCMLPEQVRGRRKLHHGDWHRRFASNVPRSAPGSFVKWARGRFAPR